MKFNMELVDGLRALSAAEYKDLEENCLEFGILDPIKHWGEYLVDGRHRLRISDKHKMVHKLEEMDFADKEEAAAWVLKNQLGKRNLTEIEVQRARASLAKLTSIEDAAQEFNVSERTIQRDVEASNAMDLMAKDIRKKCESGEIINSRSDWKRYADLSNSEREATDSRLRKDQTLTMRDAMPERKSCLSSSELNSIDGIAAFDHHLKRSIAAGSIQTDSASLKKILSLAPERQELLAVILKDPEVNSFKKALNVLSGTSGPRSTAEAIRIAVSSILPLAERIGERLKDLDAVGAKSTVCEKLLGQFVSEVSKIKE